MKFFCHNLFPLWVIFICLLPGFDFMFQEKKNWITEIRSKLLPGYSSSARPVLDHNSNTTVKFAISLNTLDLNDQLQRFTAITFLLITWTDEFLRWDPSDFGGVNSIHFDKDEVWMPDIALFNSAKSVNVAPTSTLPVLCFSNGMMMWVPPFSAEVPCQIDIAVWPSDIHTCVLRFGSWAHHGEQIDIQIVEDDPISLDFYEENKRWSIVNMTAMKESTNYNDEVYFHVDFKVTVKREAASHASYVTQTTFGVMVIILGSYLLPLSYHMSRFLLHLFSLTILVTSNFVMFITLPATGGNIPHVVKYFSGAIILTTLSLLCNVVMATVMTSSKSNSQEGIRRKLESFLKEEVAESHPEYDRREVSYSNLDEDSVEMSSNTTSMREVARTKDSRVSTLKVYRILNVVLLTMFSLAYVIDYAIMRKTIGH